MQIILENERLRVTVARHGAEIVSVYDKSAARECVWTGDASWWKRHTPVLFPIVGALWGGKMRHKGKEYAMGQHGFARDMDFECIAASETRAEFLLASNDATREAYPFDFELYVTHEITDNGSVITSWQVINTGVEEMHFQIGGHPAYLVPGIDQDAETAGRIDLHGKVPFTLTEIEAQGCVGKDEKLFDESEIVLTRDVFARDAFIFEDPCPHCVDLFDRNGRPVLTFRSNSPALGIWAPAKGVHAPFVCIEPWWGRTDRTGYYGEFAEREYITHLAPGSAASSSWSVTFYAD